MNTETLVALLGRPLTTRETTNKSLYLDIAKSNLESYLCIDLSCNPIEEERIYSARDGYSTLFLDILTEVIEVTVNDEIVDDTTYHTAYFDNRNGTVFNSIIFNTPFRCDEDVTVKAVWGFQKLPNDLQRLIAQLFAITSKAYSTGSVKRKKVEDFDITLGDTTPEQDFLNQNAAVIRKYSLCNLGDVKHGEVDWGYARYYGYNSL